MSPDPCTTALRVVYYSDARQWGGAEQVLATLIAALPASTEAVVVGVDEAVCARIAGNRGTVVVTAAGSRLHPMTWWTLTRTLAGLRADVVHVNLTWPLASVEALIAVLFLRRPAVIAHEHLPMPMRTRGHALLKRLLSWRLDGHVVVGSRAADDLARMTGLDVRRLRVIPNGVAAVRATRRDRVDSRPTVVAMGRFGHQKAFDVLTTAVSSLPGVALLLVGARDESEIEGARRLAEQAGMADRMHVRPWDEQARSWLCAADVFVLSSRFEAAPLVILEALMAGLPVVSTDVGNAAELLGRLDPQLVVPVDDPTALAAAVGHVLDDPAGATDLGRQGQALVQRSYSDLAMAGAFQDLYGQAIEVRSRHPGQQESITRAGSRRGQVPSPPGRLGR